MKRRYRSSTITNLLLMISLGAAIFMGWVLPVPGSDLFLCFAAGREHLRFGAAAPDHWSFTASGIVWVDQGWLSHIILFLVLREFCWIGPVLLKLALLVGCIAVLSFRCGQLHIPRGITIFSLYLGTMAAFPFIGLRAENFGVAAFVVFAWLISQLDGRGPVRKFAIPLVVVVWSNLHGSFILGLGLLAIKVVLVSVRALLAHLTGRAVGTSWKTAGEWTIIFCVTVVLVSWVNPFGIRNILMPFVQVGTELVTAISSDWMPLISAGHMGELVGKGTVYCYLFFLAAVMASLVMLLATHKGSFRTLGADWILRDAPPPDQETLAGEPRAAYCAKGYTPSPQESRTNSMDWLMEALTVVATIVLAFRFRRFIHFSALALVPTAAAIFGVATRAVIRRWSGSAAGAMSLERMRGIKPFASMLLACLMVWLCYRVSILPYVPANPFRPERPLLEDLVSCDTFSRPLVQFLIRNHLVGNVLAGWEISSFLLFNVPDLHLFMDVRDQSFYPPKIIRDYLCIMGVVPEQEKDRLSLIDMYGVSMVAMTTGPYDFDLARILMRTRRWSCIFIDDYSIVLVRSDEARFADMLKSARFEGLWYPDQETRARSEAIHSLFAFGTLRPDL
ncbi:MAG: hypothetical protein FJY85_00430, partial [Deltaproteobacteria bacterium]|nr:hypothetical protein [Deltaproteobacteria bacterium]